MRTLLLGTDFSYKGNGDLTPVEINTSVGMETLHLESDDAIYDLTVLSNFITQNGFVKVVYIGMMALFNSKISEVCTNLNIEYEYVRVISGNLVIPFVQDADDVLIIRSAYDTTAIVDDSYCKNKVNFLNLIKDSTYGSQFAYMDNNGTLVNNILSIPDNGSNPNFILKSTLPQYDKDVYPKLFKVSNQTELDVVLQNVTSDYHLVEYHYNQSKLYNDQIYVIRTLNLLFPPDLESIYLGSYRKFTDRKNIYTPTYNPQTFELDATYRTQYITGVKIINTPKLLDTDRVEMADGSFKTGLELEVGDFVKSLVIYNPNNVDLDDDLADFNITYNEFVSGSTYTTNRVTAKNKIDRICAYAEITFTDETDWSDTIASSYLSIKNNDVRFLRVGELESGDDVILVDLSNTEVLKTVQKTVSNVTYNQIIFSGWEITVENDHVFLTQTDNDTDNMAYAAIEHNSLCSGKVNCGTLTCVPKDYVCVRGAVTCECTPPA